MEKELEYTKSPKSNLGAYDGMITMIKVVSVGVAIILLIMAATLTG